MRGEIQVYLENKFNEIYITYSEQMTKYCYFDINLILQMFRFIIDEINNIHKKEIYLLLRRI